MPGDSHSILPQRNGLVQALVAVIQVRAERVALLFPEGVRHIVVLEDKAENLVNPFPAQGFLGLLHEGARNAFPPV